MLLSIFYVLLLALFVILFYVVIYNRYFHPLHLFPGPLWGSVTDFYHTYLFSTRKYHEKVQILHEEYGQ